MGSIIQLIFCSILLVFVGLLCIYNVAKLNSRNPNKYDTKFLIVCDTAIVVLIIVFMWMVTSNWNF